MSERKLPEGKTNFTILLDRETLEWLHKKAEEDDRSTGRYVGRLLREMRRKDESEWKGERHDG
jgi:hypothetical protein